MRPALVKARIRNLREKSDLVLAGEAAQRSVRCARCHDTGRYTIPPYDRARRYIGARLVECNHGNNPASATCCEH